MAGKRIGYGKVILFGEHFVVYGLPAIASAISNITVAEVEETQITDEFIPGLELIDNRPCVEGYKIKKRGEMERSFDLMFKFLKIDLQKTPLKITLSGNLKCASGIGASAALTSSVARALNEHFSFGLNDDQINEVSYEGEKGAAGTPSGIDNTCSTYGGMLTFTKNLEGFPNKIDLLEIKEPLKIVLASTGITQETKEVVADVKAEREKDPDKYVEIFEEYKRVYISGLEALKKGDINKVGKSMNKNQELLRQINVSCDEIEKIVSIALENGALGAKLTGTGRGGLVICLVPDETTQEKVTKAVSEAGFEATKTELGKVV
ncbi:MAG: mevalonate kinase [Candidatus Diapherotrites archaeon]|uniref:Mevalonate kinase n=1 Tax=Candidatus Iainarchaeum sp. TaxID=3101447 RepID=A0A2D6LPZ3_9ARCH|nr:mevalonate kinase [Candidatus Diapherotrites archaeon]|tara:strand:- start:11701 stop:12663 length:963 start_codon:yes stop_codon:yes gene_type:complete